jgi:hypothetical protein
LWPWSKRRHRHRPSYHPSPRWLTRAASAWTALEGQGTPQGVNGLERGELHHNGTHWLSLLIQRKDRVPNSIVRTIRRLCAASFVGSTLVGSWRLEQNLPASTGWFVDGCDTSESNWASYPLYRPRDNLAMLRGGLAKLMRMSTRNLWQSNGPKINRQPWSSLTMIRECGTH